MDSKGTGPGTTGIKNKQTNTMLCQKLPQAPAATHQKTPRDHQAKFIAENKE